MGYVFNDGGKYIILDENGLSVTTNRLQATVWDSKDKISNVKKNLRNNKVFKHGNFLIKFVNDEKTKEDKLLIEANKLAMFVNTLTEEKEKLREEQGILDKEIVDIEHAAEFYNLNAAQGYKIYKMLHDVRVKRREVKDKLEKINTILGTKMDTQSMEQMVSSMNGLEHRQYTPRVLKELFDA